MNDKTYNGWSNYETWRVNLEIFDGFDPFDNFSDDQASMQEGLMDYLKEYADEVIFVDCSFDKRGQSTLMEDYARAFLENVNWREIASQMIANYEEEVNP